MDCNEIALCLNAHVQQSLHTTGRFIQCCSNWVCWSTLRNLTLFKPPRASAFLYLQLAASSCITPTFPSQTQVRPPTRLLQLFSDVICCNASLHARVLFRSRECFRCPNPCGPLHQGKYHPLQLLISHVFSPGSHLGRVVRSESGRQHSRSALSKDQRCIYCGVLSCIG